MRQHDWRLKLNSYTERLSRFQRPDEHAQQGTHTDNEDFVVMVWKRLETNFIESQFKEFWEAIIGLDKIYLNQS